MKPVADAYLKNFFLPNRLSYLVFFVTSKCNANCSFCLNRNFSLPKNKNDENMRIELTKEEIEKIASCLTNLPHLLFSGGEPFMRNDLPEIVKAFYQRSLTRLVIIPTNGYNVETIDASIKKILMDCPDINLRIYLSINGVEEIHDKIKQLPKSFENVMATYGRLCKLKDRYPNLILASISVVTQELIDHLPEFINFLEEKMSSLDYFFLSAIREKKKSIGLLYLPPFEKSLWTDFKRRQRDKKPKMEGIFHAYSDCVLGNTAKVIIDSFRKKKAIVPCLAGRKFIVLKEDGRVFPCEMEANEDIGNIKDFQYNVNKLLKSRRALSILNQIKTKECYCIWSCAININLVNNWRYSFKIFLDALGLKAIQLRLRKLLLYCVR